MNESRSIRPTAGRALAFALAGLVSAGFVACGGGGDGGDGGGPPTEVQMGNISGMVQDGQGAGVPGAAVSASRSGSSTRNATTGSDGSFSFTGLDVGTWSVNATPPEGFEVDPSESLPKSVSVQADQTANVTILMRQQAAGTGAVAGSVTNGSMPIEGATLSLTGDGVDESATTDAEGAYRIAGVAPGSYSLEIEMPEGTALADGESATRDVTVEADATAAADFGAVHVVELVDFAFNPSTLTIQEGSTVRWVNTTSTFHTVTPDGHSEWDRAETDQPETVLEVTFDTAGTFDYFCEPHRAAGMTGQIIVEGEGAAPAPGGVSGTVANGPMPIQDATLTLTGGAGPMNATTGGDGTYSFADLEPGSYSVEIELPDGRALAEGESASKNVTVESDQTATVDFGAVHVVELRNFSFSPRDLTVDAGATVRWVNTTSTFHTVTPDGHSEWARQETNQPETIFEVTFQNPGSFPYFCEPHRTAGMTGEITVQ